MKKLLLTSAMCVVLTSTTAVANYNQNMPCPQQNKPCPCPPNAAPMKEPPCRPQCGPQQRHHRMGHMDSPEKCFKKMHKMERAKLYEELCLTQDQIDKAIDADAKAMANMKKAMCRIYKTRIKLEYLKANGACCTKINMQEQAVRRARKSAHKQMVKARKDFEKILTCEQQAKYEKILQAKRQERNCRQDDRQMKKFDEVQMDKHPMFDTEGGIIPRYPRREADDDADKGACPPPPSMD